MNHQPFESWLLAEQSLNREEQRALQVHLQECAHCTALVEVNGALKSAPMAAPASGFTQRFAARLAAQRAAERRNRIIGLVILVVGGLAIFGWSAAPFLQPYLDSPVELIGVGLRFVFSLREMFEAIASLGSILLRVLPGFLSPLVWSMMLTAIGTLVWLWARSLWQFSCARKGV